MINSMKKIKQDNVMKNEDWGAGEREGIYLILVVREGLSEEVAFGLTS